MDPLPPLGWCAAGLDVVLDDLKVLASHTGVDLAYIVWLETVSATSPDGEPLIRRRRATHVFNLDGPNWRIVHQHSDPLVDLTIPPA